MVPTNLFVRKFVGFAYEGIWTGSLEGVREIARTLCVRLVLFGSVSGDAAHAGPSGTWNGEHTILATATPCCRLRARIVGQTRHAKPVLIILELR